MRKTITNYELLITNKIRTYFHWTNGLKRAVILLLILSSLAMAQFSYKGEITVSENTTAISINKNLSTSASFNLAGHFEADYLLSPISFRLVLDPSLAFKNAAEKVDFETGVSELYGLWRNDNFDFSVGLERLTLSYSRLSLPFSIEPISKTFQPKGLLGTRLVYYTDTWRLRPAVVFDYDSKDFGGIMSVRKDFNDFELEVNLVYLNDFSLGLGGSGSVEDYIIYGEAWLIDNFEQARASLGLSGYYDIALWTVESSYSTNPLLSSSKAAPQIMGQINLPIEANSLDLSTGLGLIESALNPKNKVLVAMLSTGYNINEDDYRISINVGLAHTEFATAYNLGLSLSSYY